MKQLLLLGTFFFASNLGFSQYCMTGGPSSTADSNLESLNLNGVSGSINYVGCPGVMGIEQYTAQTATLNAGASYVVSVHFGTCGGNYPGVGEAWIDFNGDNVFSPSESILTWSGTPPLAPGNYVFPVPAGALNGPTKMRVMQAEGQSLPLDPCASFTWGSVTDFTVIIGNGIDCSGYIGNDESNPRIVGAIPFTEAHDNSVCYSNENPIYNSPDVFYLVTPGTLQSLNVSLCGSSFDTYLSVLDKYGNVLGTNDDYAACGTQSELNIATQEMDSLYVVVEGWGTEMGNYVININEGVLGAEEMHFETFGLYPNPTNSSFRVKGDFAGRVQLMNMEGRIVKDVVIANKQTIDTQSLSPGFYVVRLTMNNKTYEQKLIIE